MNEGIIRLSIKGQGEGRGEGRPGPKPEEERMILGLGTKPRRDLFFISTLFS